MSQNETEVDNTYEDDDVQRLSSAPLEDKSKTGVVYISTIPRFMTPSKVRELFNEAVGHVGRIYLKRESDLHYEKRTKQGGKRTRLYTEGWVEFTKKKYAQQAAEYLNCTPIGGKKCGNLWRNELWCVRYLPDFTWADLTGLNFLKEYTKKRTLNNELSRLTRESETYVETLLRARKKKKQAEEAASTSTRQNAIK